jgi:predicted ATPase
MIDIKPYLKSISIEKPDKKRQDSYPFNIPAIAGLDTLQFHPDVTFLIGENGSGKSTLIEAIAMATDLGGQGGTGNFAVDDASGLSALGDFIKTKRGVQKPKDRYFLRAESFYNIATYLEELWKNPEARTSKAQVFQRYGGKSLHEQSHGESFLALMVNGLGGKGFYIFDEPEAALSPARQLAALVRIDDLVRDQSQFVIATHSPILMAYPKAKIYLLDEAGCRQIAFEETEHYKVTRDFLNNYPRRLEQLLSE